MRSLALPSRQTRPVLVADKAIDERALADLLRSEFDNPAQPVFVPVGGDSWNYRAGPW